MGGDIFDSRIPKYYTAEAIYEGLEQLTNTEEMQILTDIMGECWDVTNEQQQFYYTDLGNRLKERFEWHNNQFGGDMWIINLAVRFIDASDKYESYYSEFTIHETIYEALSYINGELAKMLGIAKEIQGLLCSQKKQVEKIADDWFEKAKELRVFSFTEMTRTLIETLRENDVAFTNAYNIYNSICNKALERLRKQKGLESVIQVVIESRALLNSYDDFILGMRANQALYEKQESAYKKRVNMLESQYQ